MRRCRVLLLFTLLATALSSSGVQQLSAQTAAPRPDLAAMTVRPADLRADGWVHVGAFVHSLADQARDHAAYLGRGTTAEDVTDVLGPAGWQRQYISFLELPSPADPSRPQQRVRSYVTEYETAEGAAAGFAYLEDEESIVSTEDLPLDGSFGEQAELTSERGTGNSDGRPFRSLDLTFRIGHLVAGVTLTQYPTADRTDPDPDLVQTLARKMEGRFASSETEATLGTQVVRIRADEHHEVVTFDDAYYRLAGEDVPLAGESAEAAASRIETYADATHVYQLWQGIDAAQPAGALYGVTLLQFAEPAEAETWLTELPEILATNPFYGDLGEVELRESPGDQAIALSYAPGGGGATSPQALIVAIRVGETVARVHLVPQGGLTQVSLVAALALADAQAACLLEPGCETTVAVPDEVTDLLAPDASPAASPQASPTR